MVEFMLGLVSVMVLILGINQIASIVYYDFITIYSAREEVADALINQSAGTATGSSVYDFSSLEEEFKTALNNNGDLQSKLDEYPTDRSNQFEFLWTGDDPLEDLTGSQKASTIPVTSSLFQKVIGRGSITIDNGVYMPPWEDLLK